MFLENGRKNNVMEIDNILNMENVGLSVYVLNFKS